MKNIIKKLLLTISPLYRKIDSIQNSLENIYKYIVNQNEYNENIQNKLEKVENCLINHTDQINKYIQREYIYNDIFKTKKILKERNIKGKQVDFESILEFHYSKLINIGDNVFDIGAHAGRHLNIFKKLVGKQGKVFAFEPLPDQYNVLIEIFKDDNIIIKNMALSNIHREMDFFSCENYPEESGLNKRTIFNNKDAYGKTIKVEVDILNNYIDKIDNLKFIKIDTEGAEISILQGGDKLINKFRPFISVEYGYAGYSAYNYNRNSLYELCEKYNYFITDLFGNIIPNIEIWNNICDSVYWDYFLIPKEKLEEFWLCIHDFNMNFNLFSFPD